MFLGLKYTIVHPKKHRSKKVCITGLPCYNKSELIIDSLKAYDFTITGAAILKNHITDNYAQLYMINVLPRSNFDESYAIKEIHYIFVTIEAFKGNQNVER